MLDAAVGVVAGVIIAGVLHWMFPGVDLAAVQAVVIAASGAAGVMIGGQPSRGREGE